MCAYYDKKSLRDIDVAGKTVLCRVDFNVPFDSEGNISDTARIMAVRPTVEYLVNHGAKVILLSHLGRPKGRINPKYSLAPVAAAAQKVLGRPVQFVCDAVGGGVRKKLENLHYGGVLLLENTRFYEEEEKNSEEFARELAGLADLYVNDAFATAHRAHASTEGVAHFLPGVCGFLMEKEVRSLGDALTMPAQPFYAIIGGAKVSDKIMVVDSLLSKVSALLIGGGMANTFLAAQGCDMKDSLVESSCLGWAGDLIKRAGEKLVLPLDVVAADAFSDNAGITVCDPRHIPDGWQALDIGPVTTAAFKERIMGAGTVFWNGPLGVFEMKSFSNGTMEMAYALADCPGFTIIGGGDSLAAIKTAGVEDKINHVSTGGGASLEFLGGVVLPGIAALMDKDAPL